jgi:DNA-binding MarR family transcriptional regulator
MGDIVNQIDDNERALTLYQLVDRAHTWFQEALLELLDAGEGAALSRADLHLLANLDCGTTYTSQLARRLGVSRQAVNKLVRNLVEAGLVRLEDAQGQRNVKWIVMTERGTALVAWLVGELRDLEARIARRIGAGDARALRRALEADWGAPWQSTSSEP